MQCDMFIWDTRRQCTCSTLSWFPTKVTMPLSHPPSTSSMLPTMSSKSSNNPELNCLWPLSLTACQQPFKNWPPQQCLSTPEPTSTELCRRCNFFPKERQTRKAMFWQEKMLKREIKIVASLQRLPNSKVTGEKEAQKIDILILTGALRMTSCLNVSNNHVRAFLTLACISACQRSAGVLRVAFAPTICDLSCNVLLLSHL